MEIKKHFILSNMKQYHFTEEANYKESYLIAKLQFRKIINNFNEIKFSYNFNKLYSGENHYKLFLKKGDSLICGALGHIYEGKVFMDIFFWNEVSYEYNMQIVRLFFEEFFKRTSKKNVFYAILPLDKNRKRFDFFKRHNEIFFRSDKQFDLKDKYLKSLYIHHHLLEIKYESYFSKTGHLN